MVGPSGRKTNHLKLGSELLKAEWDNASSDPARAEERSDRQRRRHLDPDYHKAALSGLDRGRKANMWSDEEILAAIRNFYKQLGRTPSYYELRRENGLPDYSTIRRRFGSSKIAVRLAIAEIE